MKHEALQDLIGARITLFCMNYFYTGKLVRVYEECVLLEDAKIIYETGPLTSPEWKDAQPMPHTLYVMLGAVETFGIVK